MLSGKLGVQLDVGDTLTVQFSLLVLRFRCGGLSRGDAGNRHAEGTARDVLEVEAVEKRYGVRLSAVLATDAHLVMKRKNKEEAEKGVSCGWVA